MLPKSLPPRPSLDHLKHQAKDLLKALRAQDPAALARFTEFHPAANPSSQAGYQPAGYSMNAAQLVLAREYGFPSWTRLKAHVAALSPAPSISEMQSKLLTAMRAGDAAAVQSLLRQDGGLARTLFYDHERSGETCLHRHCSRWNQPVTENHLQIVRLLVDAGADVNALSAASNQPVGTPLMVHAWLGQSELVGLLLELGSDPNIAADTGELPIDTAAAHGHTETVRALIDAGSTYTLCHAVLAGLRENVEALLDADPAAVNRPLPKQTKHREIPELPLLAAIGFSDGRNYYPDIFRLLVDRGADVNKADRRGETPLARAIAVDNVTAIEMLRARGAAVDLYAAIGLGDLKLVRSMLRENPALAQRQEADGITPLFEAARAGRFAICKLLLEAGAEVNVEATRHYSCLTPLHAAISNGHYSVAKLLLEAGADPNISRPMIDEFWPSPLIVAVRTGSRKLAALLLDHGAEINAPDHNFQAALGWAATYGNNISIVRFLLKRGAEVRHPSHIGIIHKAAELGRTKIIELLARQGAALDDKDHIGRTPLQCAQDAGQHQTAEALQRVTARAGD